MKRILQITDNMEIGGIQSFLMNIYRRINRDEIQFDFLVFRDYKQAFEDEIISLGGIVYKVNPRHSGILEFKNAIRLFFNNHKEYDVIHYHTSNLSNVDALVIAKEMGIKTIIVHAHSSRIAGNRLHYITHLFNRIRIGKIANVYLSCGELATKWMYPKSVYENVRIIKNGIEIKKFSYNVEMRERYRDNLGLVDTDIVILCVGRLTKSKNLSFAIDVFSKFNRKIPSSLLYIVGDGEERKMLENKAQEVGLPDRIVFAGRRNDVNGIIQAADIFFMPSIYEGFPVTAIEAQASGIPCVISDSVTKEVLIKENVKMCSLSRSTEEWADELVCFANGQRLVNNDALMLNGLSIDNTIQQLLDIYLRDTE